MKNTYILSAVALAGAVVLSSCDDFLEDNRYPEAQIVNNALYWNNSSNCQLQVDRFIDEINPGYGSGGSYGWFYFKTLNDDQVGSSFSDWDFLQTPSTNGDWSFTQVRGANYILQGVGAATGLTAEQKANFMGIARFIRAVQYYKLVRTFGDVPWIPTVADTSDPDVLFGQRVNRDVIMDSVFADIDFAIANISNDDSKLSWSKDLVRAYKSEVALYEGTYCKYRTQAENYYGPDMARAEKYLAQAAEVSKQLMDCGRYTFGETIEDYHSLYNSVWGGGTSTVDPTKQINDFSTIGEIIFGRRYDATNGRHSTISYTASSTTTSGMSLDAWLAFLNIDGTPVPQASQQDIIDNTIGEPATFDGYDAYSIEKQIAKRDRRLSIITDPYVYYKGLEWSRAGCSGMNSSSGFGIAKYDNVLIPVNARTNSANNYTSCPIYWLSYIYLNYAEAKAELGQLSDADLNATVNKLYARAGLPQQTVAGLSAMNDPANNMGVSSLLWEIRRCRRCELMYDNWIRYWDLIRWHQLELLDSSKHPNVLLGAYVANAPKQPGTAVNGFVRPYPGTDRIYTTKQYVQAVPSGQFANYTNYGYSFEQTPLWK